MSNKKLLSVALISMWLAGCAQPKIQKNDYTQFRAEDPHSILVVPVVNHSTEVDAPDYFLSTISRPIAERGYYVFPVNMTKRVMEDEGLSDADMVHANDPAVLAKMFGADSVMYISIELWQSTYAVFATQTTVSLKYDLKSGKTGDLLWHGESRVAYSPQSNNSGGGIAGLIAMAIVAAIEKAAPNYIPLAQMANNQAVIKAGRGLPAGPYDALYHKDNEAF